VDQGSAVQHDSANYGAGLVAGRANLVLIERYDAQYPDDQTRVFNIKFGYNTNGSMIFTGDGLWHRTDMTYTDSFSDGVNRNTFAYPTYVTDPDSFASTAQYNFDFGGITRTQDPKGAVQTVTYDAFGRTDRVTNQFNGAYIRYAYHLYGDIATYSTIQNGAGEAFAVTYFDGAGRVRASSSDMPNSTGGYRGEFTFYDVMGPGLTTF
jgi:YD repeat-containing protein